MRKFFKHFLSVAALLATFGVASAGAATADLYVGGLFDNNVLKFTPSGVRSIFATGVTGADSVAFDASGNLFVSTSTSIVKIAPDGTVTPFATAQGSEAFAPGGLAFDSDGNLFAVNTGNSTIYRYTPDGTRTVFASGLSTPFGLAFNSAGDLYVSEQSANRITRFAAGSNTPTIFATGLINPAGITLDSAGNLYVAESGAGRVTKVAPDATKSLYAGVVTPRQLVFDSNGNLFVSSVGNKEIVKIDSTKVATTFATNVNAGGLAFGPSSLLSNLSTRGQVLTGERVMIAGFAITGNVPKQILVRSLGPTLTSFGVPGALPDTFLDLRDAAQQSIITNDDWASAANSSSIPEGLRPPNSKESAILISLAPGNYTAILSGKDGATGVGLAEVYDLDTSADVQLTNVSTRAFVGSNDAVMIGGFAISGGSTRVLVRALGPTLSTFGVSGALADPTIRLVNSNGDDIATNNNWQDSQAAEISATGFAPPNPLESAIVGTLSPGNYTVVVSGVGGGTGVGLFEAYKL